MKKIFLMLAGLAGFGLHAATLDELTGDRAAIERVYQAHRTGATESFEQVLPAEKLRQLVARDLARERVLRTHYGVEITSNQIITEVARIERTTRAPEMLAEIKTALGNDPVRFAESFAKPLVVERELRRRFENDDLLHAARRQECEVIRNTLLTAKASGASAAGLAALLVKTHPDSVTRTIWSLPSHSTTTKEKLTVKTLSFDDLPAQLREVLAGQLRSAGDVSAVIETPESFLLYVAAEKTEAKLAVACLSLPKEDCETWLAAQQINPFK